MWGQHLEGFRMVSMSGQTVPMGQANGPDVELVVSGTELYATYETPEGLPVLYDEALGLFCYARLDDGKLVSTGISLAHAAPDGMVAHARESDEVRKRSIEARTHKRDTQAHNLEKRED
jgi:hypothetical protein